MSRLTPLPDKIGRYQILERVGRGGMGVLYRGHDPVLDREVAVKVMLTDFAEDFELLRPRFYREAKAVAKLQHRNIVTIFEFAEEANQPHIVMEFLRGQPLATRMDAAPPLTLDDKLDIVAQLCAGLAYAHSQGVVHRDVKPANVFLLDDGTVKLLDFGIAKLTTSTLTRQGDVLGSASYMSPEQVAGSESVDGRADVWSTGVMLYELLAGRRPFEGDTPTNVIVKILKEDPAPIDTIVPTLPKALAALVGRTLEKDPAERIPRAEELGRELQRIRKALVAAGDLPPMEETQFASTGVLKALHETRQKEKAAVGSAGARSLAGGATAAPAPRRVVAPPPPAVATSTSSTRAALASSNKVLLLAVAVLLLIVGAGAAVWLGLPPLNTGKPETPDDEVVSAPPAGASGATGANLPAASAPQPQGAATPATQQPPATTTPTPATNPSAATPRPSAAAPPSQTTKPVESNSGADGGTKPESSPASNAAPPSKPATPVTMVTVSMSAAYPFQVMDGSRVVSSSDTSHQFQQPQGKALRVVAADVFLDQPVRVDGGTDRLFEYSLPGLGLIDIRAARGDCRVLLGKRDLGFPPLPPVRVVAGSYEVSLSCPDGVNPKNATTVTQGFTARVLFK